MATKVKAVEDYTECKFVITREFDAPRELVFKAWTDPRHLAQWWGPKGFTNPVCEWDVRPGGKIYDVMRAPNGDRYPMGGEFREIVPPEKLVFACGALDENGDLLFEFLHTAKFAKINGKTKLTLHSRVTMTTTGANRYIGGFETGMTLSLERLAEHLAQKTEPLVVERIFDAPAALVWKAITNKADMNQWFFELAEFKAEAGFEFRFAVEHNGFNYVHHCKVTKAVLNQALAFTWRFVGYEGDSLVTIELHAEGEKTRVRLTHTGLETFPKLPAFARENFMQGWTSLIGSGLKDFVEKSGDTSDREIVIAREFAAPREMVWEAMTNPKHVANWWGPRGFTMTIEKMDFRVGGVWQHVMRGPDGVKYPNHSVFTEIVTPEKIVFSHGGKREGGPGVSFESTWSFEKLATDKTRVTIRMVFPSATDRAFVVKEFGAIEGGKQTLERLGEFLAVLATRSRD
jgi:uncharacterized protein YndB with AHSA1/START domain